MKHRIASRHTLVFIPLIGSNFRYLLILHAILACIGSGCHRTASSDKDDTDTAPILQNGTSTHTDQMPPPDTVQTDDTSSPPPRDTGSTVATTEPSSDTDTGSMPSEINSTSDTFRSTDTESKQTDTETVKTASTETLAGTETDPLETSSSKTDPDTEPPTEAEPGCLVFNFESPVLDAGVAHEVGEELEVSPGMVIKPFTDINQGMIWIEEESEWCLEGQWLGTGPIQIDLDKPLEPPVSVSIDVNMSIGPFSYLSLIDVLGAEIVRTEKQMNPHLWPTCIPPGVAAADGLLTTVSLAAHSDRAVASIIVAYSPVPINWGYVMSFDNLSIRAANIDGSDLCPWNANGEIPDDTPRCETSPGENQKVRYLCHDKPSDIATCDECDISCLQNIVHNTEMNVNQCLTYPEEIVCGPNPNTSECCFVVYAGPDWCLEK